MLDRVRASGAFLLLLAISACTTPVVVEPIEPTASRLATRDRPRPVPEPEAIPELPPLPEFPTRPLAGTEPTIAGRTIVVDAGHGGKDPGARNLSPRPEKEIVLAIAKEVSARLRALGANVVMTRDNDTFIELDARAATAERTGADLLVSIHADSAARASAAGLGVFIARGALGTSERTARSILASAGRAGIQTRSMQRADYRVLAGHRRPSVLVECGFLTNREDAARLNTDAYRKMVAASIVDGVARALAG